MLGFTFDTNRSTNHSVQNVPVKSQRVSVFVKVSGTLRHFWDLSMPLSIFRSAINDGCENLVVRFNGNKVLIELIQLTVQTKMPGYVWYTLPSSAWRRRSVERGNTCNRNTPSRMPVDALLRGAMDGRWRRRWKMRGIRRPLKLVSFTPYFKTIFFKIDVRLKSTILL